jgi:hypothetical protein
MGMNSMDLKGSCFNCKEKFPLNKLYTISIEDNCVRLFCAKCAYTYFAEDKTIERATLILNRVRSNK